MKQKSFLMKMPKIKKIRNSDNKNGDFEIFQKIENFKIKGENNNLNTTDHSQLLDYNKYNLRIQENSMEKNNLKILINGSNYIMRMKLRNFFKE